MDKLKMQTPNKANENFEKLAAMFPNAVTESIDENGEVIRAIDKDVLMQEISCKVVEGREERYQFTWPDKKKTILTANAPINKTLRPVRNDETTPIGTDSQGNPYCSSGSVDFDNTENLYIDADISDEVVKAIAQKQPYYAVFRDNGMANDSVMTNFDQIFAAISPTTVRKVL